VCDAFRASPRITPKGLQKKLNEAMERGRFEQVPMVEVF
jgi:hypothetical protein